MTVGKEVLFMLASATVRFCKMSSNLHLVLQQGIWVVVDEHSCLLLRTKMYVY